MRVAERNTFSNDIVYALGALLALALAALAWIWLKNRKVSQAGYAWLGEEASGIQPLPLTQEEFVETVPLEITKPKIIEKAPKPRAEKLPSSAPKPRKPRAGSKKKLEEKNSSAQSDTVVSDLKDFGSGAIENTPLNQPSTPMVPPRAEPIDVDLLFKKSPLHNPKAEKQADILLKEAEAQVSDTSAKPTAPSSKKDNLIDFESFTLPPTRKKT